MHANEYNSKITIQTERVDNSKQHMTEWSFVEKNMYSTCMWLYNTYTHQFVLLKNKKIQDNVSFHTLEIKLITLFIVYGSIAFQSKYAITKGCVLSMLFGKLVRDMFCLKYLSEVHFICAFWILITLF